MRAFVILPLVAVLSCRGCQEAGTDDVRSFAAAEAEAALYLPSLGQSLERVEGFMARATRQSPGGLTSLRQGLEQKLGFDPFKQDSYASWGIDTRGGLLVFAEGQPAVPVVAIAVTDRSRFDTAVRAGIQRSDGATKASEEKVGDHLVLSAGRPFGNEVVPALHWAHVGQHALLVGGDARPALLQALQRASLKPARTLANDPTFQELLSKVPTGEALLFGRGSAAGADPTKPPSRGIATSVGLGPEGLRLDTFVSLVVPGLAAAMTGDAPIDLAARVPADAVAVILSRQARPEALQALRAQPSLDALVSRGLEPLGRAIHLDPEKEVLPLLRGPVTLSVHLTPPRELPRTRPTLSMLLDFIHVVITADVKERAPMLALLDRSRATLEGRGVKIDRRDSKADGHALTIYTPGGLVKAAGPTRLGWALHDELYVYAAGPGRLEQYLATLKTDAGRVAVREGALLEKLDGTVGGQLGRKPGASVAIVRAGVLADAASRIALGEVGLGVGALVGTALQLLRTLGDIALSVSADADGLRLEVREQLQ